MTAILAALGTLALGALGIWCLRRPSNAITAAGHNPETLPRVMGGRYLAMAALWGLAFLWGHGQEVALIFGALGALDAWLYRATNPAPHLAAAAASFAAAALTQWA